MQLLPCLPGIDSGWSWQLLTTDMKNELALVESTLPPSLYTEKLDDFNYTYNKDGLLVHKSSGTAPGPLYTRLLP